MQHRNLFWNGIVFEVRDKASQAISSISNSFHQVRQQAARTAGEVPKSVNQAFPEFSRTWNRDLTKEWRHVGATWDKRYSSFERNVRQQVNKFNSVIMGGVALAMSGYGLAQFGRRIFNVIQGWGEAGMRFSKVMEEIRFLGQVTQDDFESLTDTIIDIGISLPVSTEDVAVGALQAIKTGFSAFEAEALAPTVSTLKFFSEGAMDAGQSMEFLNAIIKQTEYTAYDGDLILDKLVATMRMTAFSIDEIWRSWKSSRAAFAMLGGDLDSFLTLLGVSRTALNPRFAGRAISTWAAALLKAYRQALDPEHERGGVIRELLGDTTFEDMAGDPVRALTHIVTRSKELFSEVTGDMEETAAQQQKRYAQLTHIFGINAVTLLQQTENYMREAARGSIQSIEDMEDAIRNSLGLAGDYMETLRGTAQGMFTILKGSYETLRAVLGDLTEDDRVMAMKVLQRTLEGIINFARQHAGLVRVLGSGLGLVGVLGMVAGGAMIAAGSIMSMYGSLLNVTIQTGALGITSAQVLRDKMGTGAVTAGKLLKVNLLKPLLRVIFVLGKIAGIAALVYMAWRHDFLRIRTFVTGVFDNISRSVERSNELLRGAPEELKLQIKLLGESEDLWDKITGALTRVRVLIQAISEVISLNKKHSDGWRVTTETMAKLMGMTKDELREMAEVKPDEFGKLMNEFNNLFQIVKGIHDFFEGFIQGSKRAFILIDRFFIGPLSWLFEKMLDVHNILSRTMIGGILGFRPLERSDLNIWNKIGQGLGTIVGFLVAIKVLMKSWAMLAGGVLKTHETLGRLKTGIKGAGMKAGKMAGVFSGANLWQWLTGHTLDRGPVEIKRLHEIKGATAPKGVHHFTTTYMREAKGIFAIIKDAIFGQKLLAKETGAYIGRTKALFAPLMSRFDLLIKGTWVERLFDKTGWKVIGKTFGTNLGKALNAFLHKGLFPLFWLMDVFGASPDDRRRVAVTSAGRLAGIWGGAKMGGLMGTAIKPGIGNIIGGIVGAIVGGIAGEAAVERIADSVVKWIINPIVSTFKFLENTVWFYYTTIRIVLDKIRTTFEKIISPFERLNQLFKDLYNLLPTWSKPPEEDVFDPTAIYSKTGTRPIYDMVTSVPYWLMKKFGNLEDYATYEGPIGPVYDKPSEYDIKTTKRLEEQVIKKPDEQSKRLFNINVREGAFSINLDNFRNPSEIASGAKQMFDKFMLMIEKADLRNYGDINK